MNEEAIEQLRKAIEILDKIELYHGESLGSDYDDLFNTFESLRTEYTWIREDLDNEYANNR